MGTGTPRVEEQKQETDQNVLPVPKAPAKTTNCTRRAKNLNKFLYKNVWDSLQ